MHEPRHMRSMDLCGSALASPFLYPFVESKDDDVDDGLRQNQAQFKCDNAEHDRRSKYM